MLHSLHNHDWMYHPPRWEGSPGAYVEAHRIKWPARMQEMMEAILDSPLPPGWVAAKAFYGYATCANCEALRYCLVGDYLCIECRYENDGHGRA